MSYPTSIKVVKMIITETGTYNDQFRRPYQSTLTTNGLNEVVNAASKTPNINASIFSGISSQILAPSAQYESMITIPEGWGERRFKFLLDLEVQYKTGGTLHEIISGYSETPASTASIYGTLDPNMVFRINNTLHVRTQMMYTPFGAQTQSQVTDCSHVLANNDWSGITGNSQNYLLRPTDIFSRAITTDVEQQLAYEGSYDASTVLMGIATKSRRGNDIPTNYLSSVLKNYDNAYSQIGIAADDIGSVDALSTAQSYSRESSATRDPFLEVLASFKGAAVQNTFTLNDLTNIDPNASAQTIYMKKGAVEIAQMHSTNQTQSWAGSDLHTHIANLLANSVPSIMMNFLIMKIAFVSTNMDFTGKLDTRIVDLDGFSQGIDMTRHAQGFVSKFENEVLLDIINSYQISIGLRMQVDLIGETWIELTIDNEKIDYVVPSFSDALLVPVLTSNQQSGRQLANDLKSLMDNVVDFKHMGHPSGLLDRTATDSGMNNWSVTPTPQIGFTDSI